MMEQWLERRKDEYVKDDPMKRTQGSLCICIHMFARVCV